jgi:hypothetical protein
MIPLLALLGAGTFIALAAIHVYWAVTGRGAPARGVPSHADGSPVFVPRKTATLTAALLLLTAAFVLIERGGWAPGVLPRPWRVVGTVGLSAVLLLRGVGDFSIRGALQARAPDSLRPDGYLAVHSTGPDPGRAGGPAGRPGQLTLYPVDRARASISSSSTAGGTPSGRRLAAPLAFQRTADLTDAPDLRPASLSG